jgi:hypothetical protein
MLILDIRFSFGFSSAPLIPASHKGHRRFVSGRVNLKALLYITTVWGKARAKMILVTKLMLGNVLARSAPADLNAKQELAEPFRYAAGAA